MSDREALLSFLRYPLGSTEKVFDRFNEMPGARLFGEGEERSLYIPGSARKRVLLVAHADTVWAGGEAKTSETELIHENGRISNPSGGLGADDRAGCAIIWLLKDLGHSILITDGEEKGSLASHWLVEHQTDFIDEINHSHQFMVQFDRGNERDYKCYDVGTDQFRSYIEKVTHYHEPDRQRSTDIKVLCKKICGVNLSIGYHHEHTEAEVLMLDAWQHTLNLAREWLFDTELPRFLLTKETEDS